jgi:drug/metabolite transporter (DMT)-like permease/surfactin synthase thioesterase subunit
LQKIKQIHADLLLLAITAIWGLSLILMKNTLQHISAFCYLSVRFTVAAFVLTVIYRKKIKLINAVSTKNSLIIGFFLFAGIALQVVALNYTKASNAALIIGLNIILVPILSAIMLKQKPNFTSILGVLLSVGGLFYLCGGVNFVFNLGDYLTLIAAICFSFQTIFIDKYTLDNDPYVLSILQIYFAATLFSIIWLFNYEPFVFNPTVLLTVFITGVFGTALAYTGQTAIQKFTSPTHTVLVFAAEPVFGLIFAAFIPNSNGITEIIGLNSTIGCILLLAGILVSELKINRLTKRRGVKLMSAKAYALATWLPDENIDYEGVKDNQAKIWGSRIELEGIETILLSHPLIKEAVVNAYANKNENIYLCAYIHAEPKLTGGIVRNFLIQRLPNYMIPKYLVFLDKMPLTSHGKIDHQSLPQPNQSNRIKTDYIKPRTKLEEHLAMLWCKVLPYTKISVKDDFFLLGGDSLAAMHLLELAGDLFSIEELIQFPTIEELARKIQSNKVAKSAHENSGELLCRFVKHTNLKNYSLICIPYAGALPMVYLPLAQSLSQNTDKISVFAVKMPDRCLNNKNIPQQNVEEIAIRCFHEIKRKINNTVILYGHCAGMGLTIEIARLLEQNHIPMKAICIGGIFPPDYNSDYPQQLDWSLEKYTDMEIFKILKEMGGFWDGLSDEAMRIVVSNLRNVISNLRYDDFRMQEYFRNNKIKNNTQLKTPIYCIAGDNDPMTEGFSERYKAWMDFSETVELKIIKGANRFCLNHHSSELADVLIQSL